MYVVPRRVCGGEVITDLEDDVEILLTSSLSNLGIIERWWVLSSGQTGIEVGVKFDGSQLQIQRRDW